MKSENESLFQKIDTAASASPRREKNFLVFVFSCMGITKPEELWKLQEIKSIAAKNTDEEVRAADMESLNIIQQYAEKIQQFDMIPTEIAGCQNCVELIEALRDELEVQVETTSFFGNDVLPEDWAVLCGIDSDTQSLIQSIGYTNGRLEALAPNMDILVNSDQVYEIHWFSGMKDILELLKTTTSTLTRLKLNKLMLYADIDNTVIVGFLRDNVEGNVKISVDGTNHTIILTKLDESLKRFAKVDPETQNTVALILTKIQNLTAFVATKNLKNPANGLPVSLILV